MLQNRGRMQFVVCTVVNAEHWLLSSWAAMQVCREVSSTVWPTSRGASSATPTCAAFSAPTSFVPSPHISVAQPAARSTRNTASFCSGDTLANTCKLQTTMLERCQNPTTSRSNYMIAAASNSRLQAPWSCAHLLHPPQQGVNMFCVNISNVEIDSTVDILHDSQMLQARWNIVSNDKRRCQATWGRQAGCLYWGDCKRGLSKAPSQDVLEVRQTSLITLDLSPTPWSISVLWADKLVERTYHFLALSILCFLHRSI